MLLTANSSLAAVPQGHWMTLAPLAVAQATRGWLGLGYLEHVVAQEEVARASASVVDSSAASVPRPR